ncbi:hypothetical protein [Ferdinandcohnia sp. Marseille-Q9671]
MFKGFLFKKNGSKKDCCEITIEEVKENKELTVETTECCKNQKSCCN